MFWKSKKHDNNKTINYINQINELKRTILVIQNKNNSLEEQVTKYKAIIKSLPYDYKEFKPHTKIKDAVNEFRNTFSCDFICLDEVELDILNIILAQIHAVKNGDYTPKAESIEKSKIFFDFKRNLVKREYIEILYNLLGIKRTSRRFENFDNELTKDELIAIIEKIYFYIELKK